MFSVTFEKILKNGFISLNTKYWEDLINYFFYGSDNFIVKPPMVMVQAMPCLQEQGTKIDFLLIFDKHFYSFFEGIDLKENKCKLKRGEMAVPGTL